jgi:hypothetical protein
LNNGLVAVAYFFLAFILARLQMQWLDAREQKQALVAANIDALATGLHYVPVALLIVTENWWVVAADVVANWLASYTGIKKGVPE